jgi:tRNA-dihydrouridine synthase B
MHDPDCSNQLMNLVGNISDVENIQMEHRAPLASSDCRRGRPLLGGRVNFPFCIAPMVGLSHIGLRLLVREYLPDSLHTLWPTEMLNSRRLIHQALGETPETLKEEWEDGIVPQILANEERFISPACQRLEKWGAQAIDINMGCPVRKALSHNYGVALMGDPAYAADIVRMTVANTNLPVTVKLRAAEQNDLNYLENFTRGLVDAGASWLCLHPREAKLKRRGNADWSQIAFLRRTVDVPIIGNGDVQTAEDALRMMEETECDAVMIGRAITARPWMLWQIAYLQGLTAARPPLDDREEAIAYGEALTRMLGILRARFTDRDAIKRFRFYVHVSHPWLNFGHSFYAQVTKCRSLDEIAEAIPRFFASENLRMAKWSDLRY